MNQTTVTLIVSAAAMVVFSFFSKKRFNVKDIFSFAGLCAATVTGVYICGTAMQLISHPEPETNRLSVGILGGGLALLSVREAYMMLNNVLPKKKSPEVVSAESAKDEKPTPQK